jgi:GAF domain-containing protein
LAREDLLARTFVEIADAPVSDFDLTGLSRIVTHRCVELFDASAAGVHLSDPSGRLRVVSSSSVEMRAAQLFELEASEGPCLDCYWTGRPIVDSNLARIRPRWGRFAPIALAAGFSSVHAVPIHIRGQVIGALNLFRADVGSLGDADVLAVQALAQATAIAMLRQRSINLAPPHASLDQSPVDERAEIEQAKGILAEQARVSVEEAFVRIRRYACYHGLTPAEVGRKILDGTLSLLTIPEIGLWRKRVAGGPAGDDRSKMSPGGGI